MSNCFLVLTKFIVLIDYVYVETNPALPYQIRRIEELTKVKILRWLCLLISMLIMQICLLASSCSYRPVMGKLRQKYSVFIEEETCPLR